MSTRGRRSAILTLLLVPALAYVATLPPPAVASREAVPAASVTVTAAPLPADAASPAVVGLLSVSCPAAGTCFAAGLYGKQGVGVTPLVEQLTDGRWTPAMLPVQRHPRGAAPGRLTVISCASASFCTALGDHLDGRGAPFAQTWDGEKWTVRKLPRPADAAQGGFVQDLSCGAVDSCVAVGQYRAVDGGNVLRPWVLTFDGHSWSAAPGPLPARAVGGVLTSVSCVTAVDCVAVGRYDGVASGTGPLAAVRSSAGWKAVALPDPSPVVPSVAELDAVSCVSARTCEAVGYVYSAPGTSVGLAERLAGGTWTARSVPAPADGDVQAELDLVACGTASRCLAAGDYTERPDDTPYVAIVDGASVTPRAIPPADSVAPLFVRDVACSATGACVGVGQTQGDPDLVLRQVGTTITSESTPTLEGTTSSSLSGVDVDTPTTAVAVGDASDASSAETGLLVTGIPVP